MNNDLISREALKEALHNEIGDHALSTAIDRVIDNAPTVKCGDFCDIETQLLGAELHGMKIGYKDAQKKLTRPQGKWIFDGCTTYCSECGYKPKLGGDNYCPNCGAKMTKDTKQ